MTCLENMRIRLPHGGEGLIDTVRGFPRGVDGRAEELLADPEVGRLFLGG